VARQDTPQNVDEMPSICSLLSNTRNTAFLLQVSHTTVSDGSGTLEGEKHVHYRQKTNILGDCLLSVVENVPLIALRKAKRTMKVSTGVSVTQQFVRVVLKTLGYAYKKVKVQ
jgi:hypothetical protein